MAPNVTQWILFGGIVLVAVWVGGLFLAVQWILNNAAVQFGLFVSAVAVLVVAHETYRHRRND